MCVGPPPPTRFYFIDVVVFVIFLLVLYLIARKTKRKRGFYLITILIVFAIVFGLLAYLTYKGYREYDDWQEKLEYLRENNLPIPKGGPCGSDYLYLAIGISVVSVLGVILMILKGIKEDR